MRTDREIKQANKVSDFIIFTVGLPLFVIWAAITAVTESALIAVLVGIPFAVITYFAESFGGRILK